MARIQDHYAQLSDVRKLARKCQNDCATISENGYAQAVFLVLRTIAYTSDNIFGRRRKTKSTHKYYLQLYLFATLFLLCQLFPKVIIYMGMNSTISCINTKYLCW